MTGTDLPTPRREYPHRLHTSRSTARRSSCRATRTSWMRS